GGARVLRYLRGAAATSGSTTPRGQTNRAATSRARTRGVALVRSNRPTTVWFARWTLPVRSHRRSEQKPDRENPCLEVRVKLGSAWERPPGSNLASAVALIRRRPAS